MFCQEGDIAASSLNTDITFAPHPASLNGLMTIQIGETTSPQTNVSFSKLTLLKPSGEVVSYTLTPIDITTGPATIKMPDTGWNSSDGNPSLNEVGMWQANIEITELYWDGTVAIKKINQNLWIDFNVIPESPIGIVALMGSSLAALGVFVVLRRRQGSSYTGSLNDLGN